MTQTELIALAEQCGAEQCGMTGEYLGFSSPEALESFAAAISAQARASEAEDAKRWKWLKMFSTIGEQSQIMRTEWGAWDEYADKCIAARVTQGDAGSRGENGE